MASPVGSPRLLLILAVPALLAPIALINAARGPAKERPRPAPIPRVQGSGPRIILLPATSPKVRLESPQSRFSPLAVEGTRGWRFRTAGSLPLATPAVAGGKVYFGGGYGSHDFYALDAATGRLAWQMHTGDDGPTAAVLLDNDVLFNTESCTLYCVDARTGRTRWKKWLGDPLMNQPAAAGGRVYMAYPGGNGQHRLACIATGSGKEIWNRPVNGDVITAPVLEGDAVYLATIDGQVYAFDAAGGRSRWSREYHATSAPWIHEGQVYVSTRAPAGRSSGPPPPPPPPGTPAEAAPAESIGELDGEAGKEVGRQAERAGARYLTDGYNRRQMKAQAAQDYDTSVGFAAPPASAKLYQATANLGVSSVASVWAFQGSRPCVFDGRLYTAQHDVLRCTEARSGRPLWEARFTDTKRFEGGRALMPPSLAGDAVYLATATGQLFCLEAATGDLRWHVEVGEPVSFQPAVMNGRVYLATDRGAVFNLDARDPRATGWAMWGGNSRHNGWMQ
jgi:Ca-activated chloride channel family protein